LKKKTYLPHFWEKKKRCLFQYRFFFKLFLRFLLGEIYHLNFFQGGAFLGNTGGRVSFQKYINNLFWWGHSPPIWGPWDFKGAFFFQGWGFVFLFFGAKGDK